MAAIVPDDALALQRLYHWERSAPDRVALTQPLGDGRLRDFTWREVIDQSRRMAAHLQGLGIGRGDHVAILSRNTAHWLMSDFAIWLAGGVSVPLYPTLAASTVRQILEHSESKLLFVGKLDGWDHMKPGVPAGLPCIGHPLAPEDARQAYPRWDDIVARTPPLTGEPTRPGEELATLIYTSGTTGMPKGVMHCFAGMAWALRAGLKRVPMDDGTRMLSYLPLAHVVERVLVEHGQLATGMHVYFADRVETFTDDMHRARPMVFFSVPRLWVKFQHGVQAQIPEPRLERLLGLPIVGHLVRRKIIRKLGLDRCVFAAGGAAPMPPELLRWFARLGFNIAEGYGMTENLAATHLTVPAEQAFGTVGRTYEGVECRLDPAGSEIQIRSPATMLGYYKEPELTRQAFTDDGWMHTGDKGVLDGRGNLVITGRVKDLFKTSKGKYVAPMGIEEKLVMHPAVDACCVTGAYLAQPIGLVMLGADAVKQAADPAARSELEASLTAHLEAINAMLDPHEQMDCLVLMTEPWTVENDLVTPTLKVRRNRIEESFAQHYERWVAMKRPVIWFDR